MDSVIKLINPNPTQREDGTWDTEPTSREVLCTVRTVSRTEYFEATRAGLSPSYQFSVFAAEYNGEPMVEYQGETYEIYRAYQNDANNYVGENLRARQELRTDYVELYAQKRGGAYGSQTDAH